MQKRTKMSQGKVVATMVETLETRRLLAVALGGHHHRETLDQTPSTDASNASSSVTTDLATTAEIDTATATATTDGVLNDAIVPVLGGAEETPIDVPAVDATVGIPSDAIDTDGIVPIVFDDPATIVPTLPPVDPTVEVVPFEETPIDVTPPMDTPIEIPTDVPVVTDPSIIDTDVIPDVTDTGTTDDTVDDTVAEIPTDMGGETPIDDSTGDYTGDITGDDTTVTTTDDGIDSSIDDNGDTTDDGTSVAELPTDDSSNLPDVTDLPTIPVVDDGDTTVVIAPPSEQPIDDIGGETTPAVPTANPGNSGHTNHGNSSSGKDDVANNSGKGNSGKTETTTASDESYSHIPLPPILGDLSDVISIIHAVQLPTAASEVALATTSAKDIHAASDQTAAAQNQNADAGRVDTTTTATVAQGSPFSNTPIQPVAAPVADATNALVSDVDHAVSEEADAAKRHGVQTDASAEEQLKLQKVVLTFDQILPVELTQAEPPQQPDAQPAAVAIAPVVEAMPVEQTAGTITLVQEIDVTPAQTSQQNAQVQQQGPQVIKVPVVQAGMGRGFDDASSRTRNIVLAVVAGVASLTVHTYRQSRRKLAAAARRAHLDPLAAWLDDPTFRQE